MHLYRCFFSVLVVILPAFCDLEPHWGHFGFSRSTMGQVAYTHTFKGCLEAKKVIGN